MNDRHSIRAAMALAAIVAALTGGGARGADTCPVGTDCSGKDNGPGIHVGSGGSNCLWLTQTTGLRFCPESFENTPGAPTEQGRVKVKGRLRLGAQSMELTSEPVVVKLPDATSTALLEVVPPDGSNPSRLGFVYKPAGAEQPVHAQGFLLSGVTLLFRLLTPYGGFTLELMFRETLAPESGVQLYRYQGYYNNPGQGVSGPFCSEPADHKSSPTGVKKALPFSVLKEHQVNGQTGVIQPSASSVTLACMSGAIATCMEEWDFMPWNPLLPKVPEANPTLLLGACIQAKRAAYFAHPMYGANDYRSFTVDGVGIRVQDDWLNTDTIENSGIEAIWDEKGAVCFNPANQRAPGIFVLQNLNPEALKALPACTAAHRQPGRLVTGKLLP